MVAATLALVMARTAADPDLWGHLRFGLDTLQSRTVTQSDPYSYLTAGQRWINHEWLAEVAFASAWQVAVCAPANVSFPVLRCNPADPPAGRNGRLPQAVGRAFPPGHLGEPAWGRSGRCGSTRPVGSRAFTLPPAGMAAVHPAGRGKTSSSSGRVGSLFLKTQGAPCSSTGHPPRPKSSGLPRHTSSPRKTIFISRSGLEQALNRQKPNRAYERRLDGNAEAHLIALAYSDAPEGYERWTLRLLQDRFVKLEMVTSVSHETIRTTLKKTILSLG